MSNVFALTQRAYRWYNDNGSETTATAAAAENTSFEVKPNGTKQYILRIGLGETGAGSIAGATTDDYQLQYSRNGGAFTNVTTSSAAVKGFNSSNLTDAGTTTNRLSAGGGSFVAGEISESGLVTDRQITANNFTEMVYALEVVPAGVAHGDTITFRVLLNGATTNMTYSVTPSMTISTVDACLANDVASASSVTAPSLAQVHVLNAADVNSASSVTAPAIGQVHVLAADDVSSASSVTTPALEEVADTVDDLLADDVSSASSVSVPAIGQVHALAADDVASASTVTAPAIGQVHVINANDVSSASSVSTPAIGQVHGLLANDVASASLVAAPAIGQVHVLTADDVASASSVSTPELTEEEPDETVDELLAEDVASASSVSVPTLRQVHALTADDVFAASGITVPALLQIHVLGADDLVSSSGVSQPSLETGVVPNRITSMNLAIRRSTSASIARTVSSNQSARTVVENAIDSARSSVSSQRKRSKIDMDMD